MNKLFEKFKLGKKDKDDLGESKMLRKFNEIRAVPVKWEVTVDSDNGREVFIIQADSYDAAMDMAREKISDGEISLRQLDEIAPTNNVGSGNIAGVNANDTGVSTPKTTFAPEIPCSQFDPGSEKWEKCMLGLAEAKHEDASDTFLGSKVFTVDADIFSKCRKERIRYERMNKFFDPAQGVGKKIKEFARKFPKKGIIVKDEKTTSMMFFRRPKLKVKKEETDKDRKIRKKSIKQAKEILRKETEKNK